ADTDTDDDPFLQMETVSNEPSADMQAMLMSYKNTYGLKDIYLTRPNGVIITTNRPGMTDQNFPDPASIVSATSDGLFISEVYGKNFYAGLPMQTGTGKNLLIFEVDAAVIDQILSDTLGLGKTGELLLISKSAKTNRINILNTLRHKPMDSVEVVEPTSRSGQSMISALAGESGERIDVDYRGEEVLAAYHPVPDTQWAVVAKMDTGEIYSSASGIFIQFGLAGLLLIAASGFLSLIMSRQLTNPLDSLKSNLELLRNGILPEKIERISYDEIGDMADNVDQLNESLKATARFAQEIGKGNFDARFTPVSDEDALGSALINMRQNLIEAEKRDKERNWIVTGVAEVGDILRSGENLEELGDEVIKFIIGKIGAVQGALYVLNDDDDNDKVLEIYASHAYNRKKYLNGRFRFAEGLVGQAAAEKDTILRTEIPDDYVTITSGILGETKPSCLLIVPLVAEEKVYGALEFAGFKKFSKSEVRFVEELSVITARTVFNIKVNERTRRLLAESQAMSNELQEKQEILRQNAEEMQATQEELKRSNHRLEEQVEEVNRTQRRMQILLENASEVITIYEEDGTITYVSPSVEPILGYSQSEMKGTYDVEKVHKDNRKAFKKLFRKLLERPDEQVTIQYQYRTKEGDYIWMEATGSNFISNPAIRGIVINSQNITERKRAEAEQRMRSKMQALSENSPDLITRLEQGLISYINPVIEEYTGQKPETYINQPVDQANLNEKVLEQWLSIVEQVREDDQMLRTEMDFPSEMGERIMQVNAIPEYDENESLESVLVVSHDITERKVIEMEIQNKNKKIADSINYAKRKANTACHAPG
ncbi:MAG: PAS domain S-box protein, partial [Cyclobacteriaceae bacterium]